MATDKKAAPKAVETKATPAPVAQVAKPEKAGFNKEKALTNCAALAKKWAKGTVTSAQVNAQLQAWCAEASRTGGGKFNHLLKAEFEKVADLFDKAVELKLDADVGIPYLADGPKPTVKYIEKKEKGTGSPRRGKEKITPEAMKAIFG